MNLEQPPSDCWGYGRATVTFWRKEFGDKPLASRTVVTFVGGDHVQYEFDTPAWQRRLDDLAGSVKKPPVRQKMGVNHIENAQFFIFSKGYIHLTLGSDF
jgi:hypothetical protein